MTVARDYRPLTPPFLPSPDKSTVRPTAQVPSLEPLHTAEEETTGEHDLRPTSTTLAVVTEAFHASNTYETQGKNVTPTIPSASGKSTTSTFKPQTEATSSPGSSISGPQSYLLAIIVVVILVVAILCNVFLGPLLCGRRKRHRGEEGGGMSTETRLPRELEEYQRSHRQLPPGRRFPTIEQEKLAWAVRRAGGEMTWQ